MRSYEATALVEAGPQQVWERLVDVAAWPTWDSGVTDVTGTVGLGDQLRIVSQAAPGRTFPVRVSQLEPPHRLQLSGGMPAGLFRGVRTYVLSPDPSSGHTRFSVREEYTGPLLPVIWRSMPDLGPSFTRFANGLKAHVESAA